MKRAWKWAKRHERKLWWAFLAASIAVAQIRNPGCGAAPTWAYVLPAVLFVGMWVWMTWTFRRRRRSP